MHKINQGQSLIELVIVIAVIAIVVGGLVFATIASIRNATLAKNQAQATKYAQEALERVRTARDRRNTNTISGFTLSGQSVTNWQDDPLWAQINTECSPCYFKLTDALGSISYQGTAPLSPETIGVFGRSIILSDTSANFGVEKTVTAIVSWSDFLQKTHESRITTILRKL